MASASVSMTSSRVRSEAARRGVVVHRAESVETAREAAADGGPVAGRDPGGGHARGRCRRWRGCPCGGLARGSVAITRSAGKTTTKEVTAAFLARRYRTFRNKGQLEQSHRVAVVAARIKGPSGDGGGGAGHECTREIRTLVAIAGADVRVWTNVGPKLLSRIFSIGGRDCRRQGGDSRRRGSRRLPRHERGRRTRGRADTVVRRAVIRTFGIENPADVRASNVEDRGLDGMRATVGISAAFAGRPRASRWNIPLLGRANLANVLAGMAGCARRRCAAAAPSSSARRRSSPASHRGEVSGFASGVTVMDDAYSA